MHEKIDDMHKKIAEKLALQNAQLNYDKTVLEVRLDEANQKIAELEKEGAKGE